MSRVQCNHKSLIGVALIVCVCPVAIGAPTVKSTVQKFEEPANVERVQSSRVVVSFRLKPGADPLERIELYYAHNGVENWIKAPNTKSVESPVLFDAPSDGLFGLYLVFYSAGGASPLPSSGTQPHRWVRVDRTAPIAQILSIKPDKYFSASRAIEIRWRAEDEDFAARPVAVRFRDASRKSFKTIALEQPAEATLRWTVPNGISGKVELKITAVDRSGNRSEYVDDRLSISDEAAELIRGLPTESGPDMTQPSAQAKGESESDTSHGALDPLSAGMLGEPDAGEKPIDPAAAKEAKRQYDLATWHRIRGENAVAIAKYKAALSLRPDFKSARNDLAALLCVRGELGAAENEYAKIIEIDEKHRPALKGLALVQAKKRNYRSAHTTLQKLLLLDPDDSDAWMNFGDVCLFMGDRRAAREAWTKAMRIERAPREIQLRAAKRLEIYKGEGLPPAEQEVSRP